MTPKKFHNSPASASAYALAIKMAAAVTKKPVENKRPTKRRNLYEWQWAIIEAEDHKRKLAAAESKLLRVPKKSPVKPKKVQSIKAVLDHFAQRKMSYRAKALSDSVQMAMLPSGFMHDVPRSASLNKKVVNSLLMKIPRGLTVWFDYNLKYIYFEGPHGIDFIDLKSIESRQPYTVLINRYESGFESINMESRDSIFIAHFKGWFQDLFKDVKINIH
jgi:hypothetical protein